MLGSEKSSRRAVLAEMLAPTIGKRDKSAMGKALVAIAIGVVFVVLLPGALHPVQRRRRRGRLVQQAHAHPRLAEFIAILIILAVLYFQHS